MSYTSKNPRNETEILVDQGVTAIAATVSGTNRVINRSGKLWVQDSAGLESPLGSNGSAGVNYLASQFAADLLGTVSTTAAGDTLASSTRSDPTKWATSTGTALITQSTNSTLRGTTNYLVAYTANAQYVESPLFTLDGSDLGKPLLVQFDLSGVSTADDVQCYVVRYNTSNVLQERILVAGTASATTPFSAQLPTSTASFRGFFVSGSTSTDKYALRWLRNATNTSLRLDSFVVGPQSLATAATVTAWQAYTPTFSSGLGTVGSISAYWRRIGSSMELNIRATAGTVTSGTAQISIPSGFSIDYAQFGNVTQLVGNASANLASTANSINSAYVIINPSDVGVVEIAGIGTGTGGQQYLFPISGTQWLTTNSIPFSLKATIPISQWSSGTTTTADRAVEEYAFTSGTWDAADTTTAFGIDGIAMGGALTTNRNKTVTWQTAVQPTDKIILEYRDSTAGYNWTDMKEVWGYVYQNGVTYGARIDSSSGNTSLIGFSQYRRPTGTTYGAAGEAWSVGMKWRVRKVQGGAAVGFPVSARNIVGDTTGTAVPTGYVGQVLLNEANATSISTSGTQSCSVALTPGTWALYLNITSNTSATVTGLQGGISSSASSFDDTTAKSKIFFTGGSTTGFIGGTVGPRMVNVSANTTYYSWAVATGATATGTNISLQAVRIA